MSWRDRDYYREGAGYGRSAAMGFGLPKLTSAVKYLLIVNIGVFILCALAGQEATENFKDVFALQSPHRWEGYELWQLITYQFIHADTWHLLMNMIALYFLGPSLERYWGWRHFMIFYLACGVAGGLAFLGLGSFVHSSVPIIGASGAILGVLGACAVLFPEIVLILVFFPVPIRVAALLFGAIYVLNVLQTRDLADACHLAGLATGLVWVWAVPAVRRRVFTRRRKGQWEKLLDEERADQELVDRILAKVHREGMQGLTWRERRALRQATARQRQRDRVKDKGVR
jgi:membrane associated rhomboid family serine protease